MGLKTDLLKVEEFCNLRKDYEVLKAELELLKEKFEVFVSSSKTPVETHESD